MILSFHVMANDIANEAKTEIIDELEPLPPPPEIADLDGSPEDKIEPEIRIIRKQGAVIEEYSINGVLYMVKVTPKKGKPYYLIDQNGDGIFDRRHRLDDIVVPQWVLFRF